jgi:hypothetical protein
VFFVPYVATRGFSAQKEKINQNELNYAKQSQFPKKSNVCNINKNKELQRKNEIGHLVKTNPNKANFRRRAFGLGGTGNEPPGRF